jgi:predicted dehydrogenase
MGKVLFFAIAGCGKIAKRHVENINHFGRLAAVCDIDEAKASCFAKKYGVPFYTDIEILLSTEKNLDVVVVCTPNGLHAQHSILSLNAGKHVLCEKPMALTVSDCRNMISAAEANKRLLLVVKQNRYNPPVIAFKECT